MLAEQCRATDAARKRTDAVIEAESVFLRTLVPGSAKDAPAAQTAEEIALLQKQTQQYVRWMESNIRQIESSVAWRILKIANKLGLLWLPRQLVALARRLKGRPVPPVVAPPKQSTPAKQSAFWDLILVLNHGMKCYCTK